MLPNPRGSGGYGTEFAKSIINNWGKGPFSDIMAGVDCLIKRGIADPERLAIGGWSYGGYITAWAVTHSSRFKSAVMGAGISNLISFYGTFPIPRWINYYFDKNPYQKKSIYENNSPIYSALKARTPTLIIHGEKDNTPPVSQSMEFYRRLCEAGVKTKMVIYPREGHSITEPYHQLDLLKRILDWYDNYLKKE
jgi:dipeptidyl aminopeptidase/acylaminoacyl peptidase